MRFFRHPSALVETGDVGEGSRVWAFAHIMAGAKIGENCNIADHCFVESGAVLGDNVTVKNHVAIWNGVTIRSGAFIGPNVSFTNDVRPRSRAPNWRLIPTLIDEGASVGANATVLCGVTVGAFALIGAGAVVTKNVPAHGVVYGNPARLRGYVCHCGEGLAFRARRAVCSRCGTRYQRGNAGVSRVDR